MTKPLNVAMVVRAFATDGGLELYAHHVIAGLLDAGHNVTVFCQSRRTDLQHPLLRVAEIPLRSDKLPKRKRLQHDYEQANRVLAGVTGFDIIHSQHYPCSFADVVTFHNHTVRRWSQVGLPWERVVNDAKCALVPAYHMRDQQDEELCRKARCLIFPSQAMQQDYYHTYAFLKAEDKPYVVAYPGASVPSGAAEAREGTHPSAPTFTFLFVGRGFRRKGLDMVLAAAARLKSAGKDFRLLVAGMKAKPLDHLRLQTLGLSDRVEYLGFRRDMPAVYAMADAAVLPSRVEPFGMAPLQAMHFGLVPIVSRVSGVSEVLSHEHDCLILDNHLDAGELYAHMARLMEQPQLRRDLQQNAIVTAQRVSWSQTVERTLEAYEKILGRTESEHSSAVVGRESASG